MGSNHKVLKKSLLASSIAAASLVASSGAMSQQVEEELIVRGIRASTVASMDIKRESVGVVDAISAEDIGKMPDSNLAESLQRIAGVSINRTNGEGAQVTIRGIDPSKNMVTLNGRNMPSVTNNATAGDKSSRAFDFATLASEGVSGVEIYKTGKANVTGGGLGGTVNLKTVRPLDLGKVKGTFGIKAVQDSTVHRSSAGEQFTPEVSGLYSWLNDDENFGVSVSASYQERDNVRSRAFVNNWQLQQAGDPTFNDKVTPPAQLTHDGVLPASAKVTNQPAKGAYYALPTDLRYVVEDVHRERTNAQLAMQFRPVETLTATIDYTYSDYDVQSDRAQQSTWYNISAIDDVTFDTGAAVATPIMYSEAYGDGGKDVSFAQQDFASRSESNSLGFNLDWEVSDELSLQFDYHDSQAVNRTDRIELGLNANVVTSNYSRWDQSLPVMGVTFDDCKKTIQVDDPASTTDPKAKIDQVVEGENGNCNMMLDGGDVSGAMGSVRWDSQDTRIKQMRFMGDWEAGFGKVSFGVDFREDKNKSLMNQGESPRITMGNWGGVNPAEFGAFWPSYFTGKNFGDAFPDYEGTTGNSNFLSNGMEGDIASITKNLEWMYATREASFRPGGDWYKNFENFPNGRVMDNGNIDVDRTISEKVTAAFVQYHGAFEIGSMPSNVVVGLRQESTDLTAHALSTVPANLQWDSDNDWSTVNDPAKPRVSDTKKSSYNNFLPNLDFDIAFNDAMKLRASYSVTMARPSYANLRPNIALGNLYLKQASTGTPDLTPFESQNFDISFEWYYGDDSFASLGYFTKKVSDYIGTSTRQDTAYGLRDARMGPRFNQAIADIQAAGGNPNSEKEQHDQMLINEGKDPSDENTYIRPNETDPLQNWELSVPTNREDLSIDGIELSVQHWFGQSGFGFQANYTMVDSDRDVDITSDKEQTAMVGLSDTANFVAFYDKNDFQARLAYNWRDKYLSSLVQGGNNAPGFVEAYSQLDMALGYNVTDSLTLTFDAINLTGENTRTYGRSEHQMFAMEDLGARYQVGARYSF